MLQEMASSLKLVGTGSERGKKMTINAMRVYIMEFPKYKGSQKWKDKCMAMSDNQVLAVYNRLIKERSQK